MRPFKAEIDNTRTDNKHSGIASSIAKVKPAVAIATVRQVSRASMVKNSTSNFGGKKSAKKCQVGLSAPGSNNSDGLNSVKTISGHMMTAAANHQNTRLSQAGSRNSGCVSVLETLVTCTTSPRVQLYPSHLARVQVLAHQARADAAHRADVAVLLSPEWLVNQKQQHRRANR